MIGAIAGDMIGSPFERYPVKKDDFFIRVAGFTDDTVLTVAVANSIINEVDFAESIKSFALEHYSLPYGRAFRRWMQAWENEPYNSSGNGSAMRVWLTNSMKNTNVNTELQGIDYQRFFTFQTQL